MAPTMKLGFSLPVAGAWATELFLEANVGLHGWPVERTLEIMAALAPERCLPAG